MRTDRLIEALVADLAPQPSLERRVAPAILLGALAALAGFGLVLGIRPDLGEALGRVSVALKHLWPLLLALAAAGAVLRSARPGARLAPWGRALLIAPALALLALAAELAVLPAGSWGPELLGHSLRTCLAAIPLLSLPVLGASLIGLRHGASLRPALTGAIAGLMSGGFGASIYALHCNEDSPLFYAVWYPLAILSVAALGAVAGSRLLRW